MRLPCHRERLKSLFRELSLYLQPFYHISSETSSLLCQSSGGSDGGSYDQSVFLNENLEQCGTIQGIARDKQWEKVWVRMNDKVPKIDSPPCATQVVDIYDNSTLCPVLEIVSPDLSGPGLNCKRS